jgi:hypothetical protein
VRADATGSPGDSGSTPRADGGGPSGDGAPGTSDSGNPTLGPSPLSRLPDTTNGIFLFADQFDPGYPDTIVTFAASHFAGTQKMKKDDNAVFVAKNPNWFLLHYRLGSSSGSVDYIHQNQWSSDWASVTTHEDWFMHNENNQRHHDDGSNWDINDIMNAGFRDYWVNSVIADMRATGAQGVFADSFEAGISGYGITDPDARFDGTNPGDPAHWNGGPTWLEQKVDWYKHVEQAFAATAEHFAFVPNIGAMITGWADIDYSGIDGAMLESFGDHLAPADWVLGMNRAMKLTGAGKFIIVQSYPDTVEDRVFLLGTYMLVKGRATFVNLAGSGVNYFPEYDLDFGAPATALPADVSGYAWNGIYKREFANGIVLVNPTDSSVQVTLPATFKQATPSGGGTVAEADIDATNHYKGGSIAYAMVTKLSLGAKNAALLLKP